MILKKNLLFGGTISGIGVCSISSNYLLKNINSFDSKEETNISPLMIEKRTEYKTKKELEANDKELIKTKQEIKETSIDEHSGLEKINLEGDDWGENEELIKEYLETIEPNFSEETINFGNNHELNSEDIKKIIENNNHENIYSIIENLKKK